MQKMKIYSLVSEYDNIVYYSFYSHFDSDYIKESIAEIKKAYSQIKHTTDELESGYIIRRLNEIHIVKQPVAIHEIVIVN